MTDSTAFVDDSATVSACDIGRNACIYKSAFVKDCRLSDCVIIGDFSRTERSIYHHNVRIQRNAMIYDSEIGAHSYTGRNCTIWHANIGKYCSLSWNLSIGGANHDYTRTTTHSFVYAPEFGFVEQGKGAYNRFSDSCTIGNDVWIAANVCICRGVTIGDGAVIGAGAVVTKDIPPYAVVVGVPATIRKYRFDDNTIAQLQAIRWWDFPEALIKENMSLFGSVMTEDVLQRLWELRESISD